jgi:hypothetical protein
MNQGIPAAGSGTSSCSLCIRSAARSRTDRSNERWTMRLVECSDGV